MAKEKIKGVYGGEPYREGEYPAAMVVGYHMFGANTDSLVDSILTREENFGTYGIKWFQAFRKDGFKLGEMNATHVSMVEFDRSNPDAGD